MPVVEGKLGVVSKRFGLGGLLHSSYRPAWRYLEHKSSPPFQNAGKSALFMVKGFSVGRRSESRRLFSLWKPINDSLWGSGGDDAALGSL
mmetsp:Transcript_18140/g.36531  ORF Transcript_18140/g.36531 Transcript_18140/m.36531 type:complete len:90 (-) Transcript_18140:2583-2852(-)|eukprot:scaffold6007_cov183-Amphora_coffeaeformis.AAC.17